MNQAHESTHAVDTNALASPADVRRHVLVALREREALGDRLAAGARKVIEAQWEWLLLAKHFIEDAGHATTDCTYPGDVCRCGREAALKAVSQ